MEPARVHAAHLSDSFCGICLDYGHLFSSVGVLLLLLLLLHGVAMVSYYFDAGIGFMTSRITDVAGCCFALRLLFSVG